MKARKAIKYPPHKSSSAELKETAVADKAQSEPMIRTQIYLNKHEYDFVQREASRRDEPMAAVIREFIDEKMEIPEDAWTNNPMLEPTPHDPAFVGHEDSGINHDHYLYGTPKNVIKVKGKWVDAPPLPDDYYDNRASRDAYDRKIRKLDESK
ncbi:MAG TPA: hypothetical protein VIJ24_04025 [Verrucomicrobiae bacterium]|jgi:hypothetical protein